MCASKNIPMLVFVAAALCGLLMPTVVLSQSVTSRAASSGDESRISDSDGGQSRSIHSQKHLSPHRMMHFGKRPLVQAPPTILDLYRQPPMRTPRTHPMPYALYFELPRDQVLEFVQPDPKMQLIEAVPDLLEYAKRSWTSQRQQQQQRRRQQGINQGGAESNSQLNLTPTTLMLKSPDDLNDSFEFSTNNIRADGGMMKKQSLLMANGGEQQEQQQQQQQQQTAGGQPEQQDASGASNGQQDGDGINLASRSISTGVPFPMRADISSYLYGRRIADPQGSLLNLGNFIKKAEPQRNAMKFMHFGR